MEIRASVAYKFYVEWLHYSEVECHVLLLLPRKGVTLQGHVMLPQEGVLRQEDVLPRMGVCYVRKTCYPGWVSVTSGRRVTPGWCVLRLEWPIVTAGMAYCCYGWNGLLLRLEWPIVTAGTASCWKAGTASCWKAGMACCWKAGMACCWKAGMACCWKAGMACERLEWPVVERLEWPVVVVEAGMACCWKAGMACCCCRRLEWPLSLMGVVYGFISCWVDWERGCRGVSKCGSRASQPPCFPATWFCTVFRTWPRRGFGESIRPFYTPHTWNSNIIDNFIYYKIVETNKKDKYYIEIRKTIVENKNKFREITLSKYFI